MDNSEEIVVSEVTKQEIEDEDSEVSNSIEQEYLCKQEADEEWEEKTVVIDGLVEERPFVSERPIHMFHAKICKEKRPTYSFEQCPAVKEEEPTTKRVRKKSRKLIESLESLEFELEKDPEPTLDEHPTIQSPENSKRVRKRSKKLIESLESEHSEQLDDEGILAKPKRGRKKKNQFVESLESVEIKQEIISDDILENGLAPEEEPIKPKKRGRPKKNHSVQNLENLEIKQEIDSEAILGDYLAPEEQPIAPRKRGRPRKNHFAESSEIKQENIVENPYATEEEPMITTTTKRIRKKSKKFLEFLETIKQEDEVLHEAREKENFTDEEYLNDEEYFTDKEFVCDDEYPTEEESFADEEFLINEEKPPKPKKTPNKNGNVTAVQTTGSEVARGEKRAYVGLYQKICPECKKVTPTGLRPAGIRVRASRDCEKCSVKLIFQCKQCLRQITDFPSIRKHLIISCNSTGYHYKCLACVQFTFVSMHKEDVERHIRRRHPDRNMEDNIIRRQNGLQSVKSGNIYACSTCPQKFGLLSTYLKHFQMCGDSTEKLDKKKEIEKMCYYMCKGCNNKITKFETAEEYNKKECNKCELKLFHTCNKCNKLFGSFESFYTHFRALHVPDKVIYECPKCTYRTNSFLSLVSHYRQAHGHKTERIRAATILTCRKCLIFEGTRDDIREHFRNCTRRVMHCDHCSFKTVYKTCMAKHFEHKHVSRDGVLCSKCNRKYKNETSFRDHLRYCGKQPYLFCDKCPYKTSYKSAIVRHRMSMHPEKTSMKGFACNLCGKLFQYDTVRRAHEYNHRKKRLCCNDCSYQTITWRGLITHMKNNHIDGKGHKCSLCGTKMRNKRNFKLHSRYCSMKPYFECEHCIFRSQKKRAIVRHLRCHHLDADKSQSTVSDQPVISQPVDSENITSVFFKVENE